MCRLFAPLVAALAAIACGGVQRAADEDWSPEVQQKGDRVHSTVSLSTSQIDPAEKTPTAVLGVRHDLMLSSASHEPRCTCLSVEVGRAEDPTFFWAGGAPAIGADSLVIAVGARGIACPGGAPDDRRRRPSISAVDQDGDDIIIEVEDLPEGRPLASGAIIPRPGSRGSIYVRPRKGGGVYGRSPGGGRCRVR
jgi:hypothetical protein